MTQADASRDGDALEFGLEGACVRETALIQGSTSSRRLTSKMRYAAAGLLAMGFGCVALASLPGGGMTPADNGGQHVVAADTERILNTSLKEYAEALKDSIVQASSGMIAGAAGLDSSYIIPEWNVTAQDSGFEGLELLSSPMRSQVASLFGLFATRNEAFTQDLINTVFEPTHQDRHVPLSAAYRESVVDNWAAHGKILTSVAQSVQDQAVLENVTVESGGGFGWGLQVYCGCTLLMTTGGGFGFGMVMGNQTSMMVSGGGGGGGGCQLFQDGKPDAGAADKPIFNIGGGGGGNLTDSAGSSDGGQLVPVKSMAEARSQIIAPQIQACPTEKLSVVGGGGGGMGFTVTTAEEKVTAHGGGLDLRFASKFAAQNDKQCDGALLSGNPKDKASADSSAYDKIGPATSMCRDMCLSSEMVKEDPTRFWQCSCQCQKKEFKKLKLSFADDMSC